MPDIRITSVDGKRNVDLKTDEVSATLISRSLATKSMSKEEFTHISSNIRGGNPAIISILKFLAPQDDFSAIMNSLKVSSQSVHPDLRDELNFLIDVGLESGSHQEFDSILEQHQNERLISNYPHRDEFYGIAQYFRMDKEEADEFIISCLKIGTDPVQELTSDPRSSLEEEIHQDVAHSSLESLHSSSPVALVPQRANITSEEILNCAMFALMRTDTAQIRPSEYQDFFCNVFRGAIGETIAQKKLSQVSGFSEVSLPNFSPMTGGDGGIDFRCKFNGEVKLVQVKCSNEFSFKISQSEITKNDFFVQVGVSLTNWEIKDCMRKSNFDLREALHSSNFNSQKSQSFLQKLSEASFNELTSISDKSSVQSAFNSSSKMFKREIKIIDLASFRPI